MKNDDILGGIVIGCVAAVLIVAGIGCCDCPKPACRCNLASEQPNVAIQEQAKQTAVELGELQTQIDALSRRVERVEQAHGITPEKPSKRRFAGEQGPEVSPPIGDPTSCGDSM